MHTNAKFYLAVCLALGACATDEDGLDTGDQAGAAKESSTEQEVVTGNITDVHSFGGNLVAEDHYYDTTPSCTAGFNRTGAAPTTSWSSALGGYCMFVGWASSNPADCHAVMVAHTPGGWSGGTCTTYIDQELPNSYSFSASNTNSATQNTSNQTFIIGAGQTAQIGTCLVTGSQANNDTYLRLIGPSGSQVAFSDDDPLCGHASFMSFTAPVAGIYTIRAGCWSSGNCSGVVAWNFR